MATRALRRLQTKDRVEGRVFRRREKKRAVEHKEAETLIVGIHGEPMAFRTAAGCEVALHEWPAIAAKATLQHRQVFVATVVVKRELASP